jgi:hypothetical protein
VDNFLNFRKIEQSKKLANGRKFAYAGHPGGEKQI